MRVSGPKPEKDNLWKRIWAENKLVKNKRELLLSEEFLNPGIASRVGWTDSREK
jgi:hypothetical protein